MTAIKNFVSIREKVFMIIELILIFVFFILTIVDLFSIIKMYSVYLNAQSYYYFFMMHNRLQIKEYNSFIRSSSPFYKCPEYPNSNQSLKLSYVPRKFLSLGKIESAKFIDITSDTQVYDDWDPSN